jgi:hypothetical protein
MTTSGTDEFKVEFANSVGYRSFRMSSLYSTAERFVWRP